MIHTFHSSYNIIKHCKDLSLLICVSPFFSCPYLADHSSQMLLSTVLLSLGFHSCPLYRVSMNKTTILSIHCNSLYFKYTKLKKKRINVERCGPATSTRPSYSGGFGFKSQPARCPSLHISCYAVP